jgi:hypothetical protein
MLMRKKEEEEQQQDLKFDYILFECIEFQSLDSFIQNFNFYFYNYS